jgi:hypothetical protein
MLQRVEISRQGKSAGARRRHGRALAETSGAIGMTSMTFVEQSKGKIKALALNHIAASEDNVVAGRYGLTRDSFWSPGMHVTAGEGVH